jgi:hypothetical protein
MLRHTTLFVALIGSFCALGCEGTAEEPVLFRGAQGLTITSHDASVFAGARVADGVNVAFVSRRTADGEATLSFSVDGRVFAYRGRAITDSRDGYYAITAGHTLSAADIAAARAVSDDLIAYLGADTTALDRHEAAAAAMAYFLAEHAPGAFVSDELHREAMIDGPMSVSLNDDNKYCIKKNTTLTAYYDYGTAGTAVNKSVVVGSDWGTSACGSGNYSCMGRCGAGCTGFGGGWTLDCLEHDACSHDLCASGGSGDANCGDEYNHASSDIFSSCSG